MMKTYLHAEFDEFVRVLIVLLTAVGIGCIIYAGLVEYRGGKLFQSQKGVHSGSPSPREVGHER